MDITGIMAIMIPLAPFLMVCFIVWTKHQAKMAELQMKNTAEKAAQYAQHTSRLEERVRVLERIVTDRGVDVSAQIEALRHDDADQTAGPAQAPPQSAPGSDKTLN